MKKLLAISGTVTGLMLSLLAPAYAQQASRDLKTTRDIKVI